MRFQSTLKADFEYLDELINNCRQNEVQSQYGNDFKLGLTKEHEFMAEHNPSLIKRSTNNGQNTHMHFGEDNFRYTTA